MLQWKKGFDSPIVNRGDVSENIKNQLVMSGLSGSFEDDKSEKKGLDSFSLLSCHTLLIS